MIKGALPTETSSDIGEYIDRGVRLSTSHSSSEINNWFCNTLSSTNERFGDRIQMEERFSAPVQTGPGAHSTSYSKGVGSLLGVKSSRGVALSTHHHLVPRLKKE
jgi:hypothetical protein